VKNQLRNMEILIDEMHTFEDALQVTDRALEVI
jgi:hypothetical protein